MAKTILIVDDEASVREALVQILTDSGYQVEKAASGEECLEKIKAAPPDVVLMDIRMPGMNGLKVLEIINQATLKIPVILMTAYGSTETTIEAMRFGAFDYLMKPLKMVNLMETIQKAVAIKELMDAANQVQDEDNLKNSDSMIGLSPIMQNIYKTIGRISNTNATVLICGESGTGKELVARAIHFNSIRRERPFIKINCASIPENLLESELFGHEKGAFTGATSTKPGKFELANRGTIFLDEIGEMSVSIQAKLLRVLQEREFERVGGNETIRADVRILAATNRDMERSIEDGSFREDLYYRLNVVEITLPPLRDRKEDLPELICHLVKSCSAEYKKVITGFAPDALAILSAYDWPGNIRELKNVCERAVLMSSGPLLTVESLPTSMRSSTRRMGWLNEFSGESLKEIVAEVEKEVILKALEECNWNRSAAAIMLKMNRSSLYIKMKELGIIV